MDFGRWGHERWVKNPGAWLCGMMLIGCSSHTDFTGGNGGSGGSIDTGAGAPAGGIADAGAPSGGASVAGAAGEAGMGGEAGASEVVPDISGRWAMILFEDPVGLQLEQHGSQLSGKGCDVFAPPLDDRTRPDMCGPITGSVHPSGTSFGFEFTNGGTIAYQYLAKEVMVSADGQRMTGLFHDTWHWEENPMTWLRLADDEKWLPYPPQPEPYKQGNYDLRLTDADGDEYSADQAYLVHYVFSSFNGPFGSFWHTEIHQDSPDGPLLVGPVPMTSPELAVSLIVDVKGGRFTRFQATTGSGHHYTFSASLPDAP